MDYYQPFNFSENQYVNNFVDQVKTISSKATDSANVNLVSVINVLEIIFTVYAIFFIFLIVYSIIRIVEIKKKDKEKREHEIEKYNSLSQKEA